ncbi:efflux RND transporter periplasmic adaptor subunit, partial [Streptococcus dysgalactiae]
MSNKTKGILGATALSLVLIGGILWKQHQDTLSTKAMKEPYSTVNVTEGNVASSTLLSGTVKALSEEYIYFDASKGSDATVTVKVGDQVTKGQQLVQYNTTIPQATYDAAVRNLNKIGRQINHLKTYGVPAATVETSTNEETGEETTTTIQPSAQQNASYKQQLQDLNDSYADAQSEVNKAQVALNDTVVVSGVSGTVVEVNNDIDPSSKNSQKLVHIATEGQLQVKGSLTEYDLANVKVGQPVKIKSKIYADQEWTGKINYISNYPTDSSNSGTGA